MRRALATVVVSMLLGALLGATAAVAPVATGPAAADPAPVLATLPGSLAVGFGHGCFARNGVVRCWGGNAVGELGVGDTALHGDGSEGDEPAAIDLGAAQIAVEVTAGGGHTCARLDDGSVKCWGGDNRGQLGYGDTTARGDGPGEMGDDLPTVDLGTGRTARRITAAYNATCALLDDGSVKCWGSNEWGQLGRGDTAHRGDDANEMGDNLPTVNLGTGRTAIALDVGEFHVCALLDNGTVKCWGDNAYGQLGLGDAASRGDNANEMGDNLPTVNLGTGRTARALEAGGFHTCAILDDGTTKCWGMNLAGQLGLGSTTNRGDDANEMGDNLPIVNLGTGRTARALATGAMQTCAVLDNATLKCWGANASGPLGQGDQLVRGDGPNEMGDNLAPIALGTGRTVLAADAGFDDTCALLDDGTLRCFGHRTGRGDDAGEMGDALPVIEFGDPPKIAELAAGPSQTCARLTDGRVACVGYNFFGELGLGTTGHVGDDPAELGDGTRFVDLGTGRTARSIAVGGVHVCAILDTWQVKCWGRNAAGQLGYGDTTPRGAAPGEMGDNLLAVDLGPGRTARAISPGMQHTCAILDTWQVKCWGSNQAGQLGYGDTNDRGDEPNEMGAQLPAVNLGTGRSARHLSSSADATCALLDDASTKCWGYNGLGGLGLGNTMDRGDEPNEMGDDLPTVDLGTGRTAHELAGTFYGMCARLDDASVKCWGAGYAGALGNGNQVDRGDGPNQMGDNLPTVNLGTGRTARRIVGLDSGACAILDTWQVKCWGHNAEGELGLGDAADRGDDANEMGDNLPSPSFGTGRTARRIAASFGLHTCVLLDDGEARCWGAGYNGDLGLGDANHRGDNANEMGDNLPSPSFVAAPDASWDVPAVTPGRRVVTVPLHVSEPVTGLTAADLSFAGTAHACTGAVQSDGPTAYAVQVTCADDGTLTVALKGGAAADAAGTRGPARSVIAATVTLEDPTPTATWTTPASPSEDTTLHYGLVTSEGIANIDNSDLVVRGTAPGCTATFTAWNGSQGTVDVHCTGQGTVIVAMQAGAGLDSGANPSPAHESAAATVVIGPPRTIQPLAPARLLDTRTGIGGVPRTRRTGTTGAMTPLVFHAAGHAGVPSSGVAAVSLNLTAVDPGSDGYATVYPCGTIPNTSSVNFVAGRTTANAVTTPLSANGDFCIVILGDAHLIVDVTGWYATGRGFTAVTPARELDTRTGLGGVTRSRLGSTNGTFTPLVFHAAGRNGVPSSGVAAVSVNLTVVEPATDGYAAIYPCGTIPNTSNVNFLAGTTTAAAAVTPLSAGGDFCVIVFGDAHVVVDVNGWYASTSGFTTVSPARLLDTRTGLGGVARSRIGSTNGELTPLVFHAAGRAGIAESGASAVSVTLTVVEPSTDGYATIYPCGTIPDTSTVNFVAGHTTANAATAPLSANGDFCIVVAGDAHVIVDVNGWYAG